MFSKSIFAMAAAAVPALAVSLDDATETQCHALTTSSATIFNIEGVEGSTDYSSVIEGAAGSTLTWNYCTYASGGPADSYAWVSNSAKVKTSVADSFIKPLESENVRDADSETIGVQFTQSSESLCANGVNWGMTTKLLCDETVTGKATVNKVKMDGCVYNIELKHADGCPAVGIDIEYYTQWLSDNQWAIGAIYLVAGPLIALFGTAWFPYVTAALIGIFIIGVVCSLSLAFGLMTSTTAGVIIFIVAVILGVLAGVLIRRKIWLMVGLLGLVAGFFSGSLIFALLGSMTGLTANWAYWVVSTIMAIVGCVLACFFGKTIVLLSTSLVGSYMFMRSWTLFFPGHYPSEQQLVDEYATIEYDMAFWIFIGIFIVSFIGTFVFQKKRGVIHEDLDNDDNFKSQD